jgi:hypothetical protein
VARAAEATAETWVQFERIYNVSRDEAIALEVQILSISKLPALIRHEVIDRIMAVDFPDAR